jgi:ferrous iron transport protein A
MAKNDDGNNQRSRNQKLKGWGFTFFGGSSVTVEAEENSVDRQSASVSGTGKSFPLAMASVGEQLEVVTLKGTEGTVHRLIGMGFVPEIEIQIISISNGSLIVALGDSRIGLGAGMAQKVICKSKI